MSKGPITWRISARTEISARLTGAETSARLLKQILLKSNCRLHGEGFSPRRNSARAENPSPVCPNRHHPTIKFSAEISDIETNFLDTTVFKGERFHKDSILDISTHFKPTEKFQYTHHTSCHAPGVKKGFIKGEALRLLRTNSSEKKFEENICNFKSNLRARGYPDYLVNKVLAEVKFTNRRSALDQKPRRVRSGLMPFVTQQVQSISAKS